MLFFLELVTLDTSFFLTEGKDLLQHPSSACDVRCICDTEPKGC